MDEYDFKWHSGHVEVYLHGVFQFSADSISEAEHEISLIESEAKGS